MKKTILKVTLVAAFALFAGYNVYCTQQSGVVPDLTSADVEALAGCEVSSDSSRNTGICSGDVNGSREYCVTSSSQWGGGPKCSATL